MLVSLVRLKDGALLFINTDFMEQLSGLTQEAIVEAGQQCLRFGLGSDSRTGSPHHLSKYQELFPTAIHASHLGVRKSKLGARDVILAGHEYCH